MTTVDKENHLVIIDGENAKMVTEELREVVQKGFVNPESIISATISNLPIRVISSHNHLEKSEAYPVKFIADKNILPHDECDVWCMISPEECFEALQVMGFKVSLGVQYYLKAVTVPLILEK